MQDQIILIFIGAVISTFVYIVNKLMDYMFKNKGKVSIYRKLVYKQIGNKNPGINLENGEYILSFPVWIEIVNAKGSPIIIRDFSAILYKNGHKVKKMKQINFQKKEKTSVYYGDSGKYSFIIPPESIMRFDLLFILKKSDYPDSFDEVKLAYYNQKNRLQTSNFKKISNSWTQQTFEIDEDWLEVK